MVMVGVSLRLLEKASATGALQGAACALAVDVTLTFSLRDMGSCSFDLIDMYAPEFVRSLATTLLVHAASRDQGAIHCAPTLYCHAGHPLPSFYRQVILWHLCSPTT